MAGCQVVVSPQDPCRSVLRASSPATQADAGDPPGYLVCGTADAVVPCTYLRPLDEQPALSTDFDPIEASVGNDHATTDYGLNLAALADFLDRSTASSSAS